MKKLIFGISIAALMAVLTWRYLWGSCWSPWETSCYVGNMMRMNDYTSHYDAWIAYLRGTTFIPPYIDNAFWPFRTSIAYADAMPLFAIAFKALAKMFNIDKDFQFFSAISLLNNFLTVAAIYFLAGKLRLKPITPILLLSVLLVTPVMTQRILIHEALAFQCIVIWSVILALLGVKRFTPWVILLCASIGIHPYFLPMVAAMMIGTILSGGTESWISPEILNAKSLSRLLVKGLIAAVLLVFSALIFGLNIRNTFINVSNQIWDMNVFALLDPQQTSALLPGLSINMPYEWEGYSYLGIGLGVLGIVYVCRRYLSSEPRNKSFLRLQRVVPTRLAWSTVILLAVYALGPNIHIGNAHIISLDFLTAHLQGFTPYALFRSTGRYIWPLYYMLVIFLVVNASEGDTLFKKLALFSVLLYLLEVGLPYTKGVDVAFDARLIDGQRVRAEESSLAVELEHLLTNDPEVVSTVPGIPKAESVTMYSISRYLVRNDISNNFTPFLARYPEGWYELLEQNPASFLQKPEIIESIQKQEIVFLLPINSTHLMPDQLYFQDKRYQLSPAITGSTLESVRYNPF